MHSQATNIFGATLNNDIVVALDNFDESFDLGYCMTTHRVQGSTIDEPISIYEWSDRHMTKNAKYTAITRATKLEFVNIMPSLQQDVSYSMTVKVKVNSFEKF